MKADILTAKTLFQKDVQYVMPIFQRPYVWEQEDQWEPLWNDVRNVAEEYLEQWEKFGEDKKVKAEQETGTHFLGAVVLKQQPTPTKDLEKRDVIDGQQRLITLQLLLRAAQKVFETGEHTSEARQMRKLISNDADYAEHNPDCIFKVWPNLVDQDAFRSVMLEDFTTDNYQDRLIVQAYEFFKVQIEEWLKEPAGMASRRAEALATALMGLFNMVVIDLELKDDANIIFETLNARGTPLLDSDLIKNSILYMAERSGLKSHDVYRNFWQSFDKTWWRLEVRQGRLFRPRLDVFLNYWLAMRTGEEISSTDFFPRFRRYAQNYEGTITAVAADIKENGEVFQRLHSHKDRSPEGNFLYRWIVMDAGATTPVVMWLFAKHSQLNSEQFYRALNTIESYLIRRMICRMTTKDYSRLFLEVMRELNRKGPEKADEIITSLLQAQTADARLWPTDARVKEAILTLPLYLLLTRGRLRLVLEGLEDELRSPKSEEEYVRRGALTIEHIMPQNWREHWPLRPRDQEDEPKAAERRHRLIHTLGNLTLVNKKLNPALANAPWETKRKEIAKHSVLHLNKQLLDMCQKLDSWDEEAIEARGKDLADIFVKVWPGPSDI